MPPCFVQLPGDSPWSDSLDRVSRIVARTCSGSESTPGWHGCRSTLHGQLGPVIRSWPPTVLVAAVLPISDACLGVRSSPGHSDRWIASLGQSPENCCLLFLVGCSTVALSSRRWLRSTRSWEPVPLV